MSGSCPRRWPAWWATRPASRYVVVDNASATPVPVLAGTEVVRTPARLSVGEARNVGLDAVASEYVVVLDADDRLIPGALAFMRGRLAADPLLAVSVTSILDAATGERHRSPGASSRGWCAGRACSRSLIDLVAVPDSGLRDGARSPGPRGRRVRERGLGGTTGCSRSRSRSGARRSLRPPRPPLPRHAGLKVSDRYQRSAKFVGSARLVRDRLRVDPAVPPSVRAVLPALGLLQLLAVFVARPVYRAAVERRCCARAAVRRAGRSACPLRTDPP